MDAGRELSSIQSELYSIIQELRSISNGLSLNFSGISSGTCADRVNEVANQYQGYLNKLYNSHVIAKPCDNHSGGGGSSGGAGSSRSY